MNLFKVHELLSSSSSGTRTLMEGFDGVQTHSWQASP